MDVANDIRKFGSTGKGRDRPVNFVEYPGDFFRWTKNPSLSTKVALAPTRSQCEDMNAEEYFDFMYLLESLLTGIAIFASFQFFSGYPQSKFHTNHSIHGLSLRCFTA
jgi:hypothetical protein